MVEKMLESQELIVGSKQDAGMMIIKGKRTKRQGPASPLLVSSTSSVAGGGREGGEERERISYNFTSPSTSIEFAESRGEEEEMANCLILLAQGSCQNRKETEPQVANIIAVRDGGGLYVYQCKTCNRRFPSFQALGGHRTSHKRPKKPVDVVIEEEGARVHHTSTTLSLQLANTGVSSASSLKSNKVHECSICGAEFSSGQALGGHMRKHRALASTFPATGSSSLESNSHDRSQEPKKPRNSLPLDLNLPAPEDDIRETEFHFASKEQVLVFSASSLVDCHY